jgi:hypothetical protein
MNNNTNRSILSGAALVMCVFIVFLLYSNYTDKNLTKKVDDIQIKNLLRNLKNDADVYYTNNQGYGDMSENLVNGQCLSGNSFVNSSLRQKLFANIKSENIRCYFEGGGKIDRWSVTIKDNNNYWCTDEGDDIKRLDTFTQTSPCN